MDPVLQRGSTRHQLEAVPDELAQLSKLGGRDPGFWEPVHPQEVGQVHGVSHVVLDPPVVEALDAEGVGEVQLKARGLYDIGRPIPAIGGLHYDLGLGPGRFELPGQ